MLPDGVECFAGDLSEQEQKVVWATHFAPAATLFTEKVEGHRLEVEAEFVHGSHQGPHRAT
jgi:hypothetical protein